MISKKEIEKKSKELGVNTSDVQRDYIFSWLLSGIYNASDYLKDLLILKGGNAFRKVYFEHARYSNDLDFSTQAEIDADKISSELNKVCQYVSDMAGVKFIVEQNSLVMTVMANKDVIYEAKIAFKGFYGEERYNIKVRMDVKEFDKIFLPVQKRNVIHSYSDMDKCTGEITCHKLEELLASKLKALIQRRHSPDLYDFIFSVFIQKTLDIDRLEVVKTFLKKTIYEPNPMFAKNLLLELPFSSIKTVWDKYLICPKTYMIDFDEAETQFRLIIPEIFGLLQPAYSHYSGGEQSKDYFSAQHRNVIMEAGRVKKMLKMIYDNLERHIEPYSLTYKIKGDGIGREYFYGWDTLGGRSGIVGIKSYTEDKVQSVEIMEKTFEPRFPIELSKAGEHFGQTYFSKPFSKTPKIKKPKRSTRKVSNSLGIVYTVMCPVCNKTFKRSSPYNTKLSKHKDRFGNRCYGTYGYMV